MKKILLFFSCLTFSFTAHSEEFSEKIVFADDTQSSYVLNAGLNVEDKDSVNLNSAVQSSASDSLYLTESLRTWRNYVRTTVNAAGINLGVWGFDRFVLNTEYSRINMKTIYKNLNHFPVWDTDKFSTNLLMHPYHGSMYFNGARLNGFSFYESVPFALGGSLMWEYLMENELPSINDLIATTAGGSALGEVTFRLSDNILDDRATGVNRVLREITAGILSPSRLFERVQTGKLWKRESYKGNLYRLIPIDVYLNFGYRTNYREEDFSFRGFSLTANVDYGDIFETEIEKPFDWFQMRFQFDMINSQPHVNHVNLIGVIHSGKFFEHKLVKLQGGLFQHFDFYQSRIKSKSGDFVTPYYISEVAAVGPGLLYKTQNTKFKADGKLFVNGILLGASYSDYLRIDDKDYNLGSGYSIKFYNDFRMFKRWLLSLNVENYYIYTFKGVNEHAEYEDITIDNWPLYNFQGDKSKAHLTVFEFILSYRISKAFYVQVNSTQFMRKTTYKFFPNVDYASFENFLSLGINV